MENNCLGKQVAQFCAKYFHIEYLKNLENLTRQLNDGHPPEEGVNFVNSDAYLLRETFKWMDIYMSGQAGWRRLSLIGGPTKKIRGLADRFVDSVSRNMLFNYNHDLQGPHAQFRGPQTCGSTACVAVINENRLFVANAGGCRCVISRNGGQVIDLSTDHVPTLEVESHRILEANGNVIHGKVTALGVSAPRRFSRAIGDMQYKPNQLLRPEDHSITAVPDINIVDLTAGDEFIVIACHGIWDVMTSAQLVAFVRHRLQNEDTLSDICDSVLQSCAPSQLPPLYAPPDRGLENMTMILVQFINPGQAGPVQAGHGQAG